ncbi:MAG: IcfA [Candidatus Nanohaloarchaeota archaeon QJJ-5]|nr:IcfA [Candidatus Nanohaloarchaeota archaeon QJJ-5]
MPESIAELLEKNQSHAETNATDLETVQDGQAPPFVTVCCSDSRVLQDGMLENNEPGQVFTVGSIGNRVVQYTDEGTTISGDVLYPLAHTETETAIVIGHTGCGAVTAAYEAMEDGIDEPKGIEHSIELLVDQIDEGYDALPEDLSREEQINHLVEYNVDQEVQRLLDSDDVPADTQVYGMVYDLHGVYDDTPGMLYVINIDGERDPATLQDREPAIDDRITRQWEY